MTFKDLMLKKGFTNNSLARKANVGQATISQIVNGGRKTIKLSTANKIAKALKVSVSTINSCIGDGANANQASNQ